MRFMAMLLAVLMVVGVMTLPATAIAESQPVPAGEYGVHYVKYGDLDKNREINATDALKVLQYSVGKLTLAEEFQPVADVNGNRSVGALDALYLLKFAVKKLSAFPVGTYYVISPVTAETPDTPATPDSPEDPTPQPPATAQEFIARYDTSNSINGAYEIDSTADTGFSADVSSLTPNTIYRLGGSVMENLDGARLVYSLQGLINRDFGMDENHTVLVYALQQSADSQWLSEITADGAIMQLAKEETGQVGMKIQRVSTWDKFYELFGEVIRSCGLVLWDGNVPATANVAGTICGVDGYLPVLAASPLHTALEADGIPVKQTLVNLFQNGKKGEWINGTALESTGSAKNDAYLWALEKYFPRCTTTNVAYVQDGAITLKGYEAYEDHPVAVTGGSHHLANHDYFIARRCFFFDLAVIAGEAACDDPAQQNGQAAPGEDNLTLRKILQARYDRADGAFGQFLGFVPWWSKYTTKHDRGSVAPSWVEWTLAEYITCYNLAKDADVANTTNHSVYYKYVPKYDSYENNRPETKTTFDPSVSYYVLYMGDYDSAGWLKDYVYQMWMKNGGDKTRGTLPLMWCYNPNLSHRLPMVFDYVQDNKTALDFFACGNSGAGYVMPSALVEGYEMPLMEEARPAGNGDATNAWADYCKVFYERFDLDITGFIINSSVPSVQSEVAHCFNQFSPVGNLTNATGTMLGLYEGTPYVYCQNGVDTNTAPAVLYNHLADRMKGYNFAAYRTVLATPSNIATIVSNFDEYAKGKGTVTQYCDPYTFFDLIRQSGQGVSIA